MSKKRVPKVLCLHGAGTNADVLKTQLAPIIYDLNKTEPIDLHFINGHIKASAAPGVAGNYDGPFYRFFDTDQDFIYGNGVVVEDDPRDPTTSPEEQMRVLQERFMRNINASPAYQLVRSILENEQTSYDGILGFSEGASIAARVLLDSSKERLRKRLRFAIFICGIPPIEAQSMGMIFADETPRRIDLPTAHVTGGSKDLLLPGGLALYNLCQQQSASRFDHSAGHTLPWGSKQTQGIARVIRVTLDRWRADDS